MSKTMEKEKVDLDVRHATALSHKSLALIVDLAETVMSQKAIPLKSKQYVTMMKILHLKMSL